MPEEVIATVIEIKLKGRSDGWSPGKIRVGGGKRTFNAVGKWYSTPQGSKVKLTGTWNDHPQWGQQFAFDKVELLDMDDEEQVRLFLEGRLPGIGEVRSRAILDHFGSDTVRVLAEEPEKLAQVRGISASMAKDIAGAYEAFKHELELAKALKRWNLDPHVQQKAIRRWNKQAVEKLEADPFELYYHLDGVGFATADKAREAAGIAIHDPRRVRALLLHLVEDKVEGEGSTCLTETGLIHMACVNLALSAPTVIEALEHQVKAGIFVRRGQDIYRATTNAFEAKIASTVALLLKAKKPTAVEAKPQASPLAELTEQWNDGELSNMEFAVAVASTLTTENAQEIASQLPPPVQEALREWAQAQGDQGLTLGQGQEAPPLPPGVRAALIKPEEPPADEPDDADFISPQLTTKPPVSPLGFRFPALSEVPCGKCGGSFNQADVHAMPCCHKFSCEPCFDRAGAVSVRKGGPMTAPCPVCRKEVEVEYNDSGKRWWRIHRVAQV